ncbi:hypothetical protein LTV02_35065 [Nocardia yamanashiensis]|uniref:hypothetical protein n=1 Tax=Nocardia yamanashiensis TaxID=209247 RepID=UPI001E5CF80B|nr:hypothetical protein [Nocardia yamanashiensis]UGT41117.1 hypothetical protein LTV02_35065 [Nocardia yamanashiensis]
MTTMRTLLTTVAALGATLALATGTAAAKVHYEWNGAQAEADGSWVWVWAPAGSDATLKYTFEGQDWKGYQYLFAHESGDSALAHSGRTPNGRRVTGFMICPSQSRSDNCSPWQDFNQSHAN